MATRALTSAPLITPLHEDTKGAVHPSLQVSSPELLLVGALQAVLGLNQAGGDGQHQHGSQGLVAHRGGEDCKGREGGEGGSAWVEQTGGRVHAMSSMQSELGSGTVGESADARVMHGGTAAAELTVVVAGVGQVGLQALNGALALHRRLAAEAQERKHGQAACVGGWENKVGPVSGLVCTGGLWVWHDSRPPHPQARAYSIAGCKPWRC